MSDVRLPWVAVHKGNVVARELADGHYTRQTPGHPMWTRPGYNFVLLAHYENGAALYCWWRPKWEDGRPGTQRKDGLRVIECTMFRRVGETDQASDLIHAAVNSLRSDAARAALHLDKAGMIEQLLTGVSSKKTARGRSKKHKAGYCYRMAGWTELVKRTGRADVWLTYPWSNPWH